MKARIISFLLLVTCFGWGGRCLAAYGEFHTTWDSLPKLYLPALDCRPFTSITIIISQVPRGAYGHVNSYGKCAQLCKWDCDVTEEGRMRLTIENAFGYGPRYLPCDAPVRVEFGVVRSSKQIVHCALQFRILGSRILPKVRIGEVVVRILPSGTGSTDSDVFIYPQVEMIAPDAGDPLWLRPIWHVSIAGAGFRTVEARGWNDCAGMTKSMKHRGPCKPDPILLSQLKVSQGVVKITFHDDIEAYVDGGSIVKLAFETEELSFWYDLLHGKIVER